MTTPQDALLVTQGPAAGERIVLGDELLIGRASSGPGRLGRDPALSRKHARLARSDSGGLLLMDVGSSNGTFVNGERVEHRELVVGDTILVGDTTLVLEQSEAPAPARHTVILQSPFAGTDPAAFRAEFPVFDRVRYLNTGTDGPVPRRAAEAAQAQIQTDLEEGRSRDSYWEGVLDLIEELRARYGDLLGCTPQEVALTRAATDGVNTVLGGLRLAAGDEIVTTDEEHQGLLAPLAAARERFGVVITVAPFDDLASAVSAETRLIACSHVSWMTGKVMDTAPLRETGVPILLDGAQGLGAVPVDTRALGCDYYAAPGQKWLCGPDRSGCLFVRESRIADLSPPAWSNYLSLADPARPLDLPLWSGARRFDLGVLPAVTGRWSLAALDVLAEPGIGWLHERSASLASQLADGLLEAGVTVQPRGRSTLVTFEVPDAPAAVERFDAAGVIVRNIPGLPWLRASLGAWCNEEDVEQVVELTRAELGA